MKGLASAGAVALLVMAGQAHAACMSVGHTGFGLASQLVEVCKATQTALSANRAAEAASGKASDLARATKGMNRRIALTKLAGQLSTLQLLVANSGPMSPLGYETGEVAFDAKVLALAEQSKPDRIDEALGDLIRDAQGEPLGAACGTGR